MTQNWIYAILIIVVVALLLQYVHHRRTHLFHLHCFWCRRDDHRMTVMYELMQQYGPEEMTKWNGAPSTPTGTPTSDLTPPADA